MTVGFFSKNEKDCDECKGLGLCNVCQGKGTIPQSSTTIAKVKCPKCGDVKVIRSEKRPFEIHCDCGTTLLIRN
jgi:ribosomal protein S27E